MRASCFTCHIQTQQPQMKSCRTNFIFLSLLILKCEAPAASKRFEDAVNNTLICHDEFMSVYISKKQFAELPFTIYVQDELSGYYQVIAIAEQCHYFLQESHTFIILTVASYGCFVREQKFTTSLTVVIVVYADKGRIKNVASLPLICEKAMKETDKNNFPALSRPFFCNKDGFNITIIKNATDPPLNLAAVWIPSGQKDNCKPHKRSADAISFNFKFTECGTQSMTTDGNITYWINIEVKHVIQKGFILRDPPFHLTVRCSFALTQMTQLSFKVQQKKLEDPLKLRSKGLLRAELRFAKDSSYRSFYSSEHPTVIELGQPLYVEVFAVKHEGEDLVLLLDDCWATPTEDPHDPQRWSLLVKGCPFPNDSHNTVVLPVSSTELRYPSLHKWFVVKLFSFVRPPTAENLVYFHCNTEICKGPDCLQPCKSGVHKS